MKQHHKPHHFPSSFKDYAESVDAQWTLEKQQAVYRKLVRSMEQERKRSRLHRMMKMTAHVAVTGTAALLLYTFVLQDMIHDNNFPDTMNGPPATHGLELPPEFGGDAPAGEGAKGEPVNGPFSDQQDAEQDIEETSSLNQDIDEIAEAQEAVAFTVVIPDFNEDAYEHDSTEHSKDTRLEEERVEVSTIFRYHGQEMSITQYDNASSSRPPDQDIEKLTIQGYEAWLEGTNTLYIFGDESSLTLRLYEGDSDESDSEALLEVAEHLNLGGL